MAGKKRLDVLLTEQGLAESRQKAQAIIMAGQVFWEGRRMDKAGASVPEDAKLEVHGQTLRYVSRGGLKLEKAMAVFDLPSLQGAVAIDAGASTGGFTDCMLQNGAAKVYAVDVGYGQLAWALRNDPSVDVSFISLRLILPALRPLLKETGELVCLVKPQFEAGREKVGKKGVVRDKAVHREVLEQFLRHAAESQFFVKDLTFSPIRGPEGNIEYLGHLTVAEQPPYTGDLAALVEASHARLEGKEP